MEPIIVDPDTGDVMLVSDAPITPDVAPPPAVTPSNNWSSSVTNALNSVVAAGGSAISSRVLSFGQVQNLPPNGGGRNMQARSTPGGTLQPFNVQVLKQNAGALLVLGLLVVAVIAFARR